MENRLRRVSYDGDYFESLDEQDAAKIHRKILHLFKMVREVVPSGVVLDAGCGAGHGLTFLQKYAEQVVGLDRFAQAAAIAAHRAPEALVCTANLNQGLPFPDASFDFVLSHEVTEHLRHPQVFVSEVFRVLRPGGCLLLKTPNAWDAWRPICSVTGRTWYGDEDKTHVHYHNVFTMKHMLKSAGFNQVKVRAGTKPFLQRRLAGSVAIHVPRLPIFGNGVVAFARKA